MRLKALRGVAIILFLAAVAVLFPVVTWAAPPAQEPGGDLPSVPAGGGLWVENCQPCHGPAGQGDGPTAQSIAEPMADFSDPAVARQYVPAENFEVIKNGRMEKMMPPWGNRLSDEQIWDLTAYVWKLGVPNPALAAGETIYADQCAACHGENGSGGDGPQAPDQTVDFTDWQAMAELSQADLRDRFQAVEAHTEIRSLDEEAVWQVLDYVRTFSFAAPQQNGVLRGQVINRTTDEPVGNVEVTLYGFQNETQVENRTVQTDEEGRFAFEGLATEHSITYVLEGTYEDIVYVSRQPAVFVPDSPEATLDLEVFETTGDADVLNITQLHYLISFAPGTVNVAQVFVVGNNSDRSYVGQDGQTFTFSLPENAMDVQFQNDPVGDRFVQTGEGYADTEAVVPGPQGLSVVAVYAIPYDGDSVTIEVPLPANVASANVLMQDQGVELTSDHLQFADTRMMQGDAFAIYNGADLSGEETLSLQLSGLAGLSFGAGASPGAEMPNPHLIGIDQDLLRWIVVGLGGVMIVLAAAVYPYLRPQLTHQANFQAADPETRRQQLLLLLARLDETYETGELDEEVYRRARAKYKRELVELME